MCLLLETIRVENGRPKNLGSHQRRVDRSRQTLFGVVDPIDLSSLDLPADLPPGVFRWRIIYGKDICESTFERYQPRKISCVRLIRNDAIDYPFKFRDRKSFLEMLERKGDCDDVLVVKNGLITDLSYANIAFFDGNEWFTPRKPLLAGTCRQRLLEGRMIQEADIRPEDLARFTLASVINAMLDLGEITFPAGRIIP
jgi:4-amino-4-deoxychorismate lyase